MYQNVHGNEAVNLGDMRGGAGAIDGSLICHTKESGLFFESYGQSKGV